MIKSEVKAANKSLRIYRPDISLDDICRTNGAAIVRAMVPCFNFPEKVPSKKYYFISMTLHLYYTHKIIKKNICIFFYLNVAKIQHFFQIKKLPSKNEVFLYK